MPVPELSRGVWRGGPRRHPTICIRRAARLRTFGSQLHDVHTVGIPSLPCTAVAVHHSSRSRLPLLRPSRRLLLRLLHVVVAGRCVDCRLSKPSTGRHDDDVGGDGSDGRGWPGRGGGFVRFS